MIVALVSMGERASCDRGGIREGERHGERLAASDLMIVLQNDRGLVFMSSHRSGVEVAFVLSGVWTGRLQEATT